VTAQELPEPADLEGFTATQVQSMARVLTDARLIESGKVFTHEDGRALDPISLRWAFQVALREWGGRKIRFHDTRHTHAAILIAAGVNVKVVQERLGHAHISTTLQIYGHLFPESDVDAAAKAAVLLRGGG
jgi:integrase